MSVLLGMAFSSAPGSTPRLYTFAMGAIQFWELMGHRGSTQQPPLFGMVLNRLDKAGLDRVALTGSLHVCSQLTVGYLRQLLSQAPVKQGFWLLAVRLSPTAGETGPKHLTSLFRHHFCCCPFGQSESHSRCKGQHRKVLPKGKDKGEGGIMPARLPTNTWALY